MSDVIGYVRCSTDRQDESLSQQQAKLEAFATQRRFRLVMVYEDEAISGSDMDRPGLSALLQRVESDRSIHAALVWDRNRLARPKDAIDGVVLERRILKADKRIFYASSNQEAGRSFADSITSLVENHQNGDYLRKLSRDTMRGVVRRAERGHWPGGRVPFGFDRLLLDADGKPKRIVRENCDGSQSIIEPTTGEVVERIAAGQRYQKQDSEVCTLIPSEPDRVEAVRRMFTDYASGKPSRYLRAVLNSAGFRTANGRMFTIPTILPMLENPAYVGMCVYNRLTRSKWHRYVGGSSTERLDESIEKQPESDWVIHRDAWPALIDQDTFDRVQARRRSTREQNTHVRGSVTRSEYLLTGLCFCARCGGKLSGQTTTSSKGIRTRYYVCSTHHNGQTDRCSERYTVPASPVEHHILELIRDDLMKLRDDRELHRLIGEEVERLTGSNGDVRERLQRRLAELDQAIAKVRDHLKRLDTETATDLGLYDEAKTLGQERRSVEAELQAAAGSLPALPDVSTIKAKAHAAFDQLANVLAGGTIEERRAMVNCYVRAVRMEPSSQTARIEMFPTVFSEVMTGVGFEPTTHGLKGRCSTS